MVSRRVRCRAGASRAPPVAAAGASPAGPAAPAATGCGPAPRPARSPAAARRAGGRSPPRPARSRWSSAKSGLDGPRPLDEEAHRLVLRRAARAAGAAWRGGRPSGGTGNSRSARSRQRHAAGRQDFEPRERMPAVRRRSAAAATTCSKLSSTSRSCFVARNSRRRSRSGWLALLAHAERLGDRGGHQLGIGERRQGDEEDAVGEGVEQLGRGLQGEARLARPARSGQGQQA